MSDGESARKRTLISIVVPVLNEEATVGPFLEAVGAVLKQSKEILGKGTRCEILFVDDGSTDQTVSRIHQAKSCAAEVRLVKLSRRFGKDAALSAGLKHARGDAVVPMDVDLQDPPEVLPKMLDAWRNGALVVNAVRADRVSDSWAKRTAALAFYKVINRISAYPVHHNVGDFRLLDRKVVDVLNQLPEQVRFMKGLFSWVGFSPVEVRFTRGKRATGTTKWRFWSLWNFALDGITGSSTLPLRIWSYVGGLVAIFAFIYAVFLVVRTITYGVDVPGYASLMVVVLFLGAVVLIALGIVGEYVGRIAIEVRRRPLYIVEGVETVEHISSENVPNSVE